MNEKELSKWFSSLKGTLENAYLQHSEPWRQSGFSGPEERWAAVRKPIADCIEESGTFLDIGCANGYLLECIMKWTAERGLSIVPYGLDLSEKLVELAKRRLHEYRDNLYVGNGWDWVNPIKFNYVHTELVYVPEPLQKAYVERIMDNYLEDSGELLVAEYRSSKDPVNLPWIDETLTKWGFRIVRTASGFDNGKELTRVVVVPKQVGGQKLV